MADPPRVISVASDYAAFLQAIRDRVAELNITHQTLDQISGLQEGYSSKLLCDPPIRRTGPLVLFILLQALGMKLGLLEDREALEAISTRLIPRKVPRVAVRAPAGEGRRWRGAHAGGVAATPD